MKKTSIIVPVYNTEDYLRECFDSIFRQNQKEIEVIAINDGSTDSSLSILEKIKKEHPNMIIISQDNQGLGAARNKGLELATGEYIYFLDSDDCLADETLETCYQCIKDNRLDIVMFDAETFGDTEQRKDPYNRTKIIEDQGVVLSGKDFAKKYWLRSFVPSVCLMYISRTFLKKYQLKFLPHIYYEDNEFHYKMLPLAQRVMYIPQKLYKRRYRTGSITMVSFDMRHARDYLQMVQAVNYQNHDKTIKIIVHGLLGRCLNSLIVRCKETGMLDDEGFLRDLYRTALAMRDNEVGYNDFYFDIENLYQISNVMPESLMPAEDKKKIRDTKKQTLNSLFATIPLSSEEKYVGIYGSGKYTERFLNEYENNVGTIKAKVIFIDSYVKSGGEKYQGHDVINVNDIGEELLDCIVVASSKYEQEICQTIEKKYKDRFKMILLFTDLHF